MAFIARSTIETVIGTSTISSNAEIQVLIGHKRRRNQDENERLRQVKKIKLVREIRVPS